MKHRLPIAIAAVVYVVLTAYLWPSYQKFLPASVAVYQDTEAELSRVSPEAPLWLITEPGDGTRLISEAIGSATSTADLVIYELQDEQVEQELVKAREEGVAVRVLLDNLNTFGRHPNQAAFDYLTAHHVPVQWAPKYFTLTHQKTLVIDCATAIVMTFNLTPQYYASSRDFAVIDRDSADVSAIEAAFDSDWNAKRETAQNGSSLVWSPGSVGTLLALIRTASSTLDIYNEEMADPRIIQALKEAAARGVLVRVDMTYATNWKSALNDLTDSGVSVRTYASTAKFYIHAKVIIADGKEAFVGSENFSQQSLDYNRELGIVLTRPDILESLESTFEKDWAGSRPYKVTAR